MPRKHIRKPGSRKYGYVEEAMQRAMMDVKENGFSVQKSAMMHGLTRGTLGNRLKQIHSKKAGRPTILISEEESLLVHAIQKLGDWGFGVDREAVIAIVTIIYLRYALWHLEKMRKLPEEHPQIYAQFKRELFVVKQHDGFFNAVSRDMKLEQTIQRSQKSCAGIIGQTRKLSYVCEWEVVYHEVLAISNAFRDLLMICPSSRESELHHESSGSYTQIFNTQALKLLEFMKDRENPYVEKQGQVTKLHNFVTSVSVCPTASKRFLNMYNNGKEIMRHFVKKDFYRKQKS